LIAGQKFKLFYLIVIILPLFYGLLFAVFGFRTKCGIVSYELWYN